MIEGTRSRPRSHETPCVSPRSSRTPRGRESRIGVTTYALGLATTFHAYYRDRRVVDPSDPETSGRRLALVDITRQALRNALTLLGISAPEAM